LQRAADKIDNLIMTRTRGVKPQVELAGERVELLAGNFLQLVQIKIGICRRRG
jgi:hypothetical protein